MSEHFERLVFDDDGLPLRWLVDREGSSFRCRKLHLTSHAETAWWQHMNGDDGAARSLHAWSPGAEASFDEPEAARLYFAHDGDPALVYASFQFFGEVDPSNYR